MILNGPKIKTGPQGQTSQQAAPSTARHPRA